MKNCELCGGTIDKNENMIISVEAETGDKMHFHNGCYNEYMYNHFYNLFDKEMICKDCAEQHKAQIISMKESENENL